MSSTKRKIDLSYNPYKTLGVDPSSSKKEIANAYKKLALKFHPDKNPGNNEAQKNFIAVHKAYEFLCDEDQKKEYDEAITAKKRRAEYEDQRKANSSVKRQHFLDKLRESEQAFESRRTASPKKKSNSKKTSDSTLDIEDELLIRRLRKEGAQLLKKMAEEAENAARQREMHRRQKEQEEVAKASVHPQSHVYNMSLDELDALEKEVLGL